MLVSPRLSKEYGLPDVEKHPYKRVFVIVFSFTARRCGMNRADKFKAGARCLNTSNVLTSKWVSAVIMDLQHGAWIIGVASGGIIFKSNSGAIPVLISLLPLPHLKLDAVPVHASYGIAYLRSLFLKLLFSSEEVSLASFQRL